MRYIWKHCILDNYRVLWIMQYSKNIWICINYLCFRSNTFSSSSFCSPSRWLCIGSLRLCSASSWVCAASAALAVPAASAGSNRTYRCSSLTPKYSSTWSNTSGNSASASLVLGCFDPWPLETDASLPICVPGSSGAVCAGDSGSVCAGQQEVQLLSEQEPH